VKKALRVPFLQHTPIDYTSIISSKHLDYLELGEYYHVLGEQLDSVSGILIHHMSSPEKLTDTFAKIVMTKLEFDKVITKV